MQIIRQNSLCFIIMPTYQCNLTCDYCFSQRRDQKLAASQLESLFTKIEAICQIMHTCKLSFYWIGGEVFMLGHQWFKKMDQACRKIFTASKEKQYAVRHHIQSNIVLYQEPWKTVLHQIFQGNVGSSLDFPNLYRKQAHQSARDFSSLWLKKRNEMIRDGLRVGVIALPNAETIALGPQAFYDYYFEEIGLKSLQINNPYTVDFQKEDFTLNIDKYTQFMVELFKLWWQKGRLKGIELKPFQFFIEMIRNPGKQLPCLWSPECGSGFFSIAPNGDIGLCDSLVSNYPQLHYGNIFRDESEKIVHHPNRINFIKRAQRILDSECNDCPYCTICFGGCVTRAYPAQHDVNARDIYCQTYQELFKVIESYTQNG